MSRKKPGTVRIIGGRWRGRRLSVPNLPGLRPSGDRGRETLFNWLQAALPGARCADLFAGTGVLGLEAASRGAAQVVLVERAAPAAKAIEESVRALTAGDTRPSFAAGGGIRVVRGDALRWLEECEPASIDIAFVDPPFGSGLASRALERLAEGKCLAAGALVYLESPYGADTEIPAGWTVVREKRLGDVLMRLLEWPGDPSDDPSEAGHLG